MCVTKVEKEVRVKCAHPKKKSRKKSLKSKEKSSKPSLLDLLGLGLVASIILALNLLHNVLHLLDLALPLGLAHLCFAAEELVVGLAVAATEAIPESGELSVVVVEVQVVHGVASGAVDNRAVGNIFTVVDHDGPDVDEHEQSNVGELLQREEEGEDVVRQRLSVAVERVESVRGEWRRHDPLVVRLVQLLVNHGVVQAAVNPVDEEVGEADEEGELEKQVPATEIPR